MIKKILKYTNWILRQSRSSLFSIVILMSFGAIAALTGVLLALVSKKLFDAAQFGEINTLIQSGIVMIAIVLVQTVLQAILVVYSSRVSIKLSNTLRGNLFHKLMKAQWLEFTKYHSEDVLTHMTNDLEAVTSGVVSVIPNMISFGFTLCASMVVLIIYDPLLALFAFILGPASILFTRLFSRKLKEYYLRIQENEGAFRSFIQECLKNMHIVKTFRLEGENSIKLSLFQNTRLEWVLKRSRISAISTSVLSLLFWVGYLLALLWGSVRLAQGTATFGTITIFLQLVGQVQEPFTGLAYSVPQLIIMYAAAGRLMKLYDMKDDMKEDSVEENELKWNSAGISSENLEFSYDSDSSIIKSARFNLHPGDFAAVTGPSGEGKTTFIRLLLSLLKPDEGHLIFYNPDTQEKRDASVLTRSLTSYVPQGNTLFSGTISENVSLGNRSANLEEIIGALKKACIWDFVNSLPDKQETRIGENGYGLSEGQAQRISIARALINKKPVLILDEATSALDSETELEVLQSIASLEPKPTCIIITHRKAALDFCNRTLIIENGAILEASNSSREYITEDRTGE
jgi:ABC-type multidrug transport system fused ATPase/permease subunit